MVAAANTVAVLIFVAARAVRWKETLVLVVAATIGGYLGALVGRRAPSRVIRAGTLSIAACITLLFFAHAYLKVL